MTKIRRSRILLVFGVVFALALVVFLFIRHDARQTTAHELALSQQKGSTILQAPPGAAPQHAGSAPPRRSRAEAMREAVRIVQSIYAAPISFYGKLQDQFGNPIDNARIDYGAIDKFWAKGTDYHGYSDKDGYFSLTGIGGAGLTVGVNKDGYDGIKGKSFQVFGYGMGVDESRKSPPTKNVPALFVLRKMAPADNVIFIGSHDYVLSHDGTPVSISLETGKHGVHETSAIQVSCWTNEESRNSNRLFDWTFDVSVPGGGLVERVDENLFVAPEDGYTPSSRVWFDRGEQTQRWSFMSEKQYFVRLPDGRYGRISIKVRVGGTSFVELESVLNPTPGSRNLEYDPKLAVKIP